jgi:hypothetical protein
LSLWKDILIEWEEGKKVGFSLLKIQIFTILLFKEKPMPTKTSVKKAKKTSGLKRVKKTDRKITKKVTWDEIQAGFKELQELHKETEKALKETQKNIGGLNNSLGSMVEHILTPGLPKKFKKFGYSFTRIASYKYAAGVWAQIDGMLENGTQAMAVEVKMTLRQIDIDDHINRMEKIRKYADEHGDKRKFIGAIAAIIIDESTKNYALKKGLFVIEPSGEDVKVTKPDTEPRVW